MFLLDKIYFTEQSIRIQNMNKSYYISSHLVVPTTGLELNSVLGDCPQTCQLSGFAFRTPGWIPQWVNFEFSFTTLVLLEAKSPVASLILNLLDSRGFWTSVSSTFSSEVLELQECNTMWKSVFLMYYFIQRKTHINSCKYRTLRLLVLDVRKFKGFII